MFWDPGSVVSQDLVLFEIVGNSKLIMLAPQQKFRGSKNSEKCFSNAVLWSTDVRFLLIHSYYLLYCMYCIVLYVLYCIVLYCIVLYCIVLYCIVLYCIVLYCIVLYCIVLYCVVLHCVVDYHI